MKFRTFKKSVLSEDIATDLLSLVKEKKLRPGDKLPPERELATTMQVSRPSLREALRALSIMNILEIRQGGGTYVTSLEPKLLTEHLDFVFSLDDSMFLELFEARKVLEPGIAALAAQHITDEKIAALEKFVAKFEADVDFYSIDVEFHEMIIEASQNPILSRFMTSLHHLGSASRRRTVQLPGVREQVKKDHQAIVDGLRVRDPEMARQAMLQHLQNVEKSLKEAHSQ